MKTTLLAAAIFTILVSCNSPSNNKGTTASELPAAVPGADTVTCYRHLAGQQQQDTALVHLIMDKDQVSGSYINAIFEKDRRQGSLRGTKTGNKITAIWTFSQEGQTDSLPVVFELAKGQLRQKPYSYTENGREFIADSSAYSLIFQEIDCGDLLVKGKQQ